MDFVNRVTFRVILHFRSQLSFPEKEIFSVALVILLRYAPVTGTCPWVEILSKGSPEPDSKT